MDGLRFTYWKPHVSGRETSDLDHGGQFLFLYSVNGSVFSRLSVSIAAKHGVNREGYCGVDVCQRDIYILYISPNKKRARLLQDIHRAEAKQEREKCRTEKRRAAYSVVILSLPLLTLIFPPIT